MPPKLALLLCLLLVAVLLRIEHERSRHLGFSSWLPTLWVSYCASRPVSSWFGPTANLEELASLESGNATERLVLLLLIAWAFWVLFSRPVQWTQILREQKWLVALYLYMLISIVWSEFPYISLKRWVKTFGTFVIALVVYSSQNPGETLISAFKRCVYVLIPLSAMLVKYFPHLGVSYGRWSGGTMWQGATMTKNTLGALCMVCILMLTWHALRRWGKLDRRVSPNEKWADLVVLALSVWLMRGPGGAYSATSISVLLVGLLIFFSLRRSRMRGADLSKYAFSWLAAAVSVLVALRLVGSSPVAIIATLANRDTTLTGRTDLIWSELIPIALENPLFGLGYGSFWIRPLFSFPINQAHNGYLDVIIELGIVGLLLLALVLWSLFRKGCRDFDDNRDWASLRMAFLAIIVIHNWTETSYLRSTILLWNVFVLLVVVNAPKVASMLKHETRKRTERREGLSAKTDQTSTVKQGIAGGVALAAAFEARWT